MSPKHSPLVEELLEMGRERRQIVNNLRDAILRRDTDSVYKYASEIVGLTEQADKLLRKTGHIHKGR